MFHTLTRGLVAAAMLSSSIFADERSDPLTSWTTEEQLSASPVPATKQPHEEPYLLPAPSAAEELLPQFHRPAAGDVRQIFPRPGAGDAPQAIALPAGPVELHSQWERSSGLFEQEQYGPLATLRVFCPPDARLWINDRETTSRGAYRLLHVQGVGYQIRREFTIRAESSTVRIVGPVRIARLRSGDQVTVRFEEAPLVYHPVTTPASISDPALPPEPAPKAPIEDDSGHQLEKELENAKQLTEAQAKKLEELSNQVRKLGEDLRKERQKLAEIGYDIGKSAYAAPHIEARLKRVGRALVLEFNDSPEFLPIIDQAQEDRAEGQGQLFLVLKPQGKDESRLRSVTTCTDVEFRGGGAVVPFLGKNNSKDLRNAIETALLRALESVRPKQERKVTYDGHALLFFDGKLRNLMKFLTIEIVIPKADTN